MNGIGWFAAKALEIGVLGTLFYLTTQVIGNSLMHIISSIGR